MHLALLFSCLLLLSLRATAGPLDDLQVNFQTRCDFAEVDRDQQLKKLDTSYLAALDRQLEKAKATGKLDAVLPLMDEVQAVKTAKDPLPELPQGTSLELKQMRAKHTEARAKILKSHAEAIAALADKMETALKAKEQELTKAGNIDEAIAAKKMRETLAEDQGIINARDLIEVKTVPKLPGNWRSLLATPMKILESGSYDITLMSAIQPDTKYYPPFVDVLKSQNEKPEKILITMSPAKIEYRFPEVITQARGKIILGNSLGSFRLKIHNGKNEVFNHFLNGEQTLVPYELKFEGTKLLRIEVDPVENTNHDWAALLNPEIR